MSKIAVIGLVGNSAFMRVEKFHEAGETINAKEIHFEPGGKGFNQAVAAARFSSEVSFLSAVGNEYKSEIEDFMAKENIKGFLIEKKESTAFATILTDSKGANQVTVFRGASLESGDVDCFKEQIENADILLINNEVNIDVLEKAICYAKKGNTFVILNPAPSIELSDYIIENTDLFTPNEHETQWLEDRDNMIVTLGSKGCFIKQINKTLGCAKVKEVIDTTGAGDTFNGVLASAISRGVNIERAAEIATMASGVSVTKRYAASSIPTRKQVEDYFKTKFES